MEKIENGKYHIFLRDDYLREINRVRGSSERNACIENAILEYLVLPEDVRYRETQRQTVHVMFPADVERPYLMGLETVYMPDETIDRVLSERVYRDLDPDRIVNTAIRLWLVSRGAQNISV